MYLPIKISFVFILGCITCICTAQSINLETKYLKLVLNKEGNVAALTDKASGRNYSPAGQSSALLSLYKDSIYFKPVAASFNQKKNLITLKYGNGSIAEIMISGKDEYIVFRLKSLIPRNKIQAVVWGPYATSIQESIGETICVVHDNQFGIGMQALDINTIEGLPEGNDNAGGGSFIDPLPGQYLPDSLKSHIGEPVQVNVNVRGDMPAYVRMYRGSAAVKKNYGSELRLFSRDRRIPRIIDNGGRPQFAEPVDVDFLHSGIAFFGCPETEVINVIEKIELSENLPHQMLNGKWVKRSSIPGQAYLMFEGKDMNKGIEYARQFGFKLIHIGDLFQSWGHFGLKTKRYPGGAAEIKKVTDTAWSDSIALGVHTLTMFTGTNDAYVSPVPSDSVCKAGSSVLIREAGISDNVLYIKDPLFFKGISGTRTVKIGKELIGYREVSKEVPWRLLDCKRGQFGTKASAHALNSGIDKLVNNDYSGFYPDINLQNAYADRLAAVCNETGLGLMDFDGYGGESPTGHGTYGAAKFIDRWYRNLNRYVLTCGAGTFHYYWHILSFMNWGEPWYNALRQSQVNYRLENQRYFQRNYIPHMLGWFSMGADYRVEETEWIQARSAAFNAGYLLRVDENFDNNGFKEAIFTAVQEWQKARAAKAFSLTQIQKLSDPENEFHLESTGQGSWNLYPVVLKGGYEHKFRYVQTGEPVADRFNINNPFEEQPLLFYAVATSSDGNAAASVSNIRIELNQYQHLELDGTIKAGDKLIGDTTGVYLCDKHWDRMEKVYGGAMPTLTKGLNALKISSDFSGAQSPVIKFEFKCIGEPEKILDNSVK